MFILQVELVRIILWLQLKYFTKIVNTKEIAVYIRLLLSHSSMERKNIVACVAFVYLLIVAAMQRQ